MNATNVTHIHIYAEKKCLKKEGKKAKIIWKDLCTSHINVANVIVAVAVAAFWSNILHTIIH